jgi:hypothetical protein
MGIVGLVFAPLVLLALGRGQPVPKRAAGTDAGDLSAQLRKPSVLALCAASGFIAFGGYASGAFSPAFLIRAHGMSVGSTGVQLGLLQGGTGVALMLTLGWLGGRLSRRDPRWPLALLAGTAAVSIPLAIWAFRFAEGPGTVVYIALGNLISTSYLALLVACLHGLVPVAVRARVSAVLLFCTAILGGLGPLFAGMISDALTGAYGPYALGRALVLITPASYAAAALCFIAASLTFRRDMDQEPQVAAVAERRS